MFLKENLKTRPKSLMELQLSNTTINLDSGFKMGLGHAGSCLRNGAGKAWIQWRQLYNEKDHTGCRFIFRSPGSLNLVTSSPALEPQLPLPDIKHPLPLHSEQVTGSSFSTAKPRGGARSWVRVHLHPPSFQRWLVLVIGSAYSRQNI